MEMWRATLDLTIFVYPSLSNLVGNGLNSYVPNFEYWSNFKNELLSWPPDTLYALLEMWIDCKIK